MRPGSLWLLPTEAEGTELVKVTPEAPPNSHKGGCSALLAVALIVAVSVGGGVGKLQGMSSETIIQEADGLEYYGFPVPPSGIFDCPA